MNDLAAEVLRHAQRDAPEVSVRRGTVVEYVEDITSEGNETLVRVTFRRVLRGVAPVAYHVQTSRALVFVPYDSFDPQPSTRIEWKTLLTLSDARLALACLPNTNDADYKLYAGELRVAAFGVVDTVVKILEAVV